MTPQNLSKTRGQAGQCQFSHGFLKVQVEMPTKKCINSHRGTPQLPHQPILPTSTAQGFANGRAEAGQSKREIENTCLGIPGRWFWGRVHLQKTSIFATGRVGSAPKHRVLPRAFFYSPHRPQFFRQLLNFAFQASPNRLKTSEFWRR